MNTFARLVVVGASVSSGALVAQLRADGFTGRILVVDRDPDAPYDRPPLSKEFLAGTTARPEAPWWDGRCDLVQGQATGLDIASSAVDVVLADGTACTVGAEHIIVAAGSAPVRQPGQPPGLAHLRTAADAQGVAACCQAGESTGRPAAAAASRRRLSYVTNEVSPDLKCWAVPR